MLCFVLDWDSLEVVYWIHRNSKWRKWQDNLPQRKARVSQYPHFLFCAIISQIITNSSSLNKVCHDRDGVWTLYLILISVDFYDFISPFFP